jgi:hypothetical protein
LGGNDRIAEARAQFHFTAPLQGFPIQIFQYGLYDFFHFITDAFSPSWIFQRSLPWLYHCLTAFTTISLFSLTFPPPPFSFRRICICIRFRFPSILLQLLQSHPARSLRLKMLYLSLRPSFPQPFSVRELPQCPRTDLDRNSSPTRQQTHP